MFIVFYLPSNDMLDSFRPIPKCLTSHLYYHQFMLMELLIAKTKNYNSQGLEAALLKIMHACLISRYNGRVGA